MPYDLGKKPKMMTSVEENEAEPYYPCTRIPLEAVPGAPTDGSEFTVTCTVCARSVDNKDESMDMEIKSIAYDGKATKEKSDKPSKSAFRSAVEKTMSVES